MSITSITPSFGPVGTDVVITGSGFTTTGNAIHFGIGGISNVSDITGTGNQLRFTVPRQVSPCDLIGVNMFCAQIVQEVIPGSYDIYVTNRNGTSNKITFSVTSGSVNSGPRIIRVNGPSTLVVGQTGTWTVDAVVNTGAQLTYSVVWGDEVAGGYAPMMLINNPEVQQTAGFTHVYTRPGVYIPKFTAQDSQGRDTQTSLSVEVTDSSTMPLSLFSLAPYSGSVGRQVVITGSGFTSTENTIHFGAGVIPYLISQDHTTLVFTVPSSLDPLCFFSNPRCLMASQMVQPGMYPVSVSNANGTSNALNFTVVVY